jgi:protein-tyrosine-phosphatase
LKTTTSLFLALTFACQAQDSRSPTVVFVCEHGSAKSVIAAAHFNQLAEERGLPYRAISRGVHPDSEIPANIRAGLLSDGLKVSGWKPTLISDEDIRRAERVVTLSCELPKSKSLEAAKLVDWPNLPAVSNGYAEARAAIVVRIEELLTTLAKVQKK